MKVRFLLFIELFFAADDYIACQLHKTTILNIVYFQVHHVNTLQLDIYDISAF